MYKTIRPGQIWLDTEGKRIQAHGAQVFYENGTYYWVGENKEKTLGKDKIWTWGIRLYSSKDLYNWTDEGLIVEPDTENENSPLHPFRQIDRPHMDETFGLIETVEKAAQIYMLTAHLPRVNTIKDEEMLQLVKLFGVDYRKDFLNIK